MEKPEDARTAPEHLVRFYDTDDELVNTVVPFLAAGLDADESVLVIATEHHRHAFERELALMDVGLEQAITAGTFVAVDATEILDFMQENGSGEITTDNFEASMGMLVRRHLASGRGLRVYGEVVALLWDRGEASAAVALEAMWNELQRRHPFRLFCGYPVVSAPAQLEAVQRVCRAHSLVLPATTGDPQPDASSLDEQFAPDIQAPRRVRALLRSALGDLQFREELIERLTLAASELSANAVVHARTPFRLLVQPRAASVWLAVEDRAPLRSPLDVVGRTPHGLGLIAALAVRWGVTPRASGKIVWAEIPR
jgi:hypothetical protein